VYRQVFEVLYILHFEPSLDGRLTFTARRHEFNKDSLLRPSDCWWHVWNLVSRKSDRLGKVSDRLLPGRRGQRFGEAAPRQVVEDELLPAPASLLDDSAKVLPRGAVSVPNRRAGGG